MNPLAGVAEQMGQLAKVLASVPVQQPRRYVPNRADRRKAERTRRKGTT